jgi:hypothetical protein
MWVALAVDQAPLHEQPRGAVKLHVVHILAGSGIETLQVNPEDRQFLCVVSVVWVTDSQAHAGNSPWRLSGAAALGPLAWASWADLWKKAPKPARDLMSRTSQAKEASPGRLEQEGGGPSFRFATP